MSKTISISDEAFEKIIKNSSEEMIRQSRDISMAESLDMLLKIKRD